MAVSGNQKVRPGWAAIRVPLGDLTNKILEPALVTYLAGIFEVDYAWIGEFETDHVRFDPTYPE